MSEADLATLSLLDPDQGVCPNGHPCRLDDQDIGQRRCAAGEYRGLALICWDITTMAIDDADSAGADPALVGWARAHLVNRGWCDN
jgi:hypothetical protein